MFSLNLGGVSSAFSAARTMRVKFCGWLAITLCAGVFFPCAEVFAETSETRMTQAIASVMAASHKAADVDYGYIDGTSVLGAFLPEKHTVTFKLELKRGEQYLFLGGGDENADDVDIEVFNSDNEVVAKDTDTDKSPVVFFTPRVTDSYILRLKLYKGEGAFCAMAILKKNGWTVPVENLTAATRALIANCVLISEKSKASLKFHDEDNQWCFYGAVLNEGSEATVINLTPGNNIIAFIGATDGIAIKTRLELMDDDNNVLKADRDDDNTKLVIYRTQGNSTYRIRHTLIDSRRSKPSMVVVATLAVIK